MVIYKYPLAMTDEQTVSLPMFAKILSFVVQREQPVLYALIYEGEKRRVDVPVYFVGTGQQLPTDVMSGNRIKAAYRTTLSFGDGSLMLHVFMTCKWEEI